MKNRTAAFLILILMSSAFTFPAAGKDADVLSTLRPGHPRLIALPEDVERVRGLIRSDPDAAALYRRLRAEAEGLLTEPVLDYTPEDFRKNVITTYVLLGKVRQCVDRVYVLLTVYRLEGDTRFRDRAKAELMNAAALPSWNPGHFLDTAEMTHAVAIGYDWLYDELSEDERATLRNAIVNNGLKPALTSYRGHGLYLPYGFWTVARHNWSQVCNGGITLGALAVADEEPEMAEKILDYALESIQRPMAEFAPDGAWAEGPGYWDYATQYNVIMLAGLNSALGSDHGLSAMPGFDRTGMFRIHSIGPLGLSFNYADAKPATHAAEQMYWLARAFDQPLFAWNEKKYLDSDRALGLWWYEPAAQPADPPLDALFQGAEVAFMRSAWDDPDAIFIGFKGGDNHANHSHLDLGSFVLDAEGVRWAVDLGGDSYKLPMYFDTYLGSRWKYFRLRTESHNTLLINGKNQNTRAKARIIAFQSEPDRAFAVADLSASYRPEASRVQRGIALPGRSRVVVQDEIAAPIPVSVVWSFMTGAKISIDGSTAVLEQDSKRLAVHIIEPGDAYFEVVSAHRDPPEDPNEGINNLTIRLPGKVKNVRIAVEMVPFQDGPPPAPAAALLPLREW